MINFMVNCFALKLEVVQTLELFPAFTLAPYIIKYKEGNIDREKTSFSCQLTFQIRKSNSYLSKLEVISRNEAKAETGRKSQW